MNLSWKVARITSTVVVAACGMTAQVQASDVERTVKALTAELADAISSRDAVAAARHVREDAHVVYVSDGTVIRGTEYRKVLADFYAGLRQLDFKWERSEVRVVGSRVAVFTGWAAIHAVDANGVGVDTRAIFTILYAHTGAGWEAVTAHKTTVH